MTVLDKVIRAPGDRLTENQKLASRYITLFAHDQSMSGKPCIGGHLPPAYGNRQDLS